MAASHEIMIFIDGQYVYHETKKIGVKRINYEKFANLLCNGRYLKRAYYFDAAMKGDHFSEKQRQKQTDFFNDLRRTPYYAVVLGRLVARNGKIEQKETDVLIAVNMLYQAASRNYDTGILVTGDSDFKSLVEAVKDCGRQVEIAASARTVPDHLRHVCDVFIPLTEELFKSCAIEFY